MLKPGNPITPVRPLDSVISPSLVPKVGELLDATVERPAEQLLFVAKRGVGPNH
jgi:hypothetical protein